VQNIIKLTFLTLNQIYIGSHSHNSRHNAMSICTCRSRSEYIRCGNESFRIFWAGTELCDLGVYQHFHYIILGQNGRFWRNRSGSAAM